MIPALLTGVVALALQADTIRLEVGSPLVNGQVYTPHVARVRVRIGTDTSPLVAEWTNELTLGDSAGRPVMRWVTRGTRYPPGAAPITWEIYQTYDAVTLAPMGFVSRSSTGAEWQLTLDGREVRGTRRLAGDPTLRPVDLTLERAGFIASASDLVPLAVGLRPWTVLIAPVWGPPLAGTELRVFTILEAEPVDVEGQRVRAYKVEERRHPDGTLVATWWLTAESPFMVYGEVPLPDGRIQRMTEVAVPAPNPEQALGAGDHEFTLRHRGRARRYLLHVPARLSHPAPVVLAFHGGGGDPEGAGHGWPGNEASPLREELSGPSSSIVEAAEEVWRFVGRFRR
ncbi:MAG: hypothetical protein ACT4PM_00165 [Gemmatimonadales bacterium]